MTPADVEFAQLITATLRRYFAQNAQSPPLDAELTELAARLWALVEVRGLPRPLEKAEQGMPGEMSDAEVAPLLERVLDPVPEPGRTALVGPAKQLVKACFYPEFKTCRDSFREVSPDGTCRRQELARARLRVSGSHCVDCPHWVALTPEQHVRFLERNWQPAGRGDFATHRGVFLPEDFRALRRWLYDRARSGI